MDWIVQGKINDMLEQVQSKRSEVGRVLSELDTLKRKVEADLSRLRRKYVQSVEQYM
ncbi:hypothetical protein D3C77_649980 [compost metagenome]